MSPLASGPSVWFPSHSGAARALSLVCLVCATPARASLWEASYQDRPAPAAIVVPVERFSDALATDLALNGLGTGLDLMSTDWAINRGCVEGNRLAPRVEGRVALKVGAAALRGSVAYWLRRRGHKLAADVWRWLAS